MKRISFLCIVAVLVLSCGGKKKKASMTGTEKIAISDFIDFFPNATLPFYYADSMMAKKDKDSSLISYAVFTQIVPDTIISRIYGKNVKPKIYALGKIMTPAAETYLFVKTVASTKKVVYILALDRKLGYVANLASLQPDQSKATFQAMTMDKKGSITKTVLRRNADGSTSEGKDVYAFDRSNNSFSLIMTDALEDKPNELINPIDTLARKNKWSADYTSGKMNLVSIRDGRRSDRVSFFIHFEKNNGECTGELKGEARIMNATTAEFRVDGDPCVLSLIFSSSAVRLKEVEGCGNHRSMECLFDGSFARKKEAKPKKPAKK